MIWIIIFGLACIIGISIVMTASWLSKKPEVDVQKAGIQDKPATKAPLAPDNFKLKIKPARIEHTSKHSEEEKPEPKDIPIDDKADDQPDEKKVVYGRLDLNVIPWAKVYFRNKLLGETPLEGKKLPVGELRLLIVNKDLGVSRFIRVKIRARKTTQKVVDLQK